MRQVEQEVLILGAGQIGLAVAKELASQGTKVNIHCRRESSVIRAANYLPPERIISSWSGDLAFGLTPLKKGQAIVLGEIDENNYHVDESSITKIAYERYASIIKESNTPIVIDCLNLATQLADPASWPSSITDIDPLSIRNSVGLLASLSVMKGHALALDSLLAEDRIFRYIKVSTTGLGKRGLEIPFTHGDTGSKLSPNLWRKLYLSGANHQFLWALSRTFGSKVKLIVPAAFIGFEFFEDLFRDKSEQILRQVESGENRSYSCEELALISSRYQMGIVTKEEVAEVVIRAMDNQEEGKDVLSSMKSASITPSQMGDRQRRLVLEKLHRNNNTDVDRLIYTGSLGMRVDNALHFLSEVKKYQQSRGIPLGNFLLDFSKYKLHFSTQDLDKVNTIINWIKSSVYGAEDNPPQPLDKEIAQILNSIDWSEGELLAYLWRDDEVRNAIL